MSLSRSYYFNNHGFLRNISEKKRLANYCFRDRLIASLLLANFINNVHPLNHLTKYGITWLK
ncbi:hypothetical protein BMETH_692_1 [methanotrophic bacterial endosymbiont of Bathymodiolus sp.]|nr:hypothetical protein BMETH_692_1 [methanotrophic bacterial endosymbiont of Bathymodiolus sp.]